MLLHSSLISSALSSSKSQHLSHALRVKDPSNLCKLFQIPRSLNLLSVNPNPSCSSSSSDNYNNATTSVPPAIIRKRKRYRKMYPGEEEGIVQEMRFVAMKLRKAPPKDQEQSQPFDGQTWEPSIDGFLNFLVDSKLLFETLERIVDESNHVACMYPHPSTHTRKAPSYIYAYFRKTGLERSEALSKDLEWFRQQGFPIPEPGSPGINYANYLEETAEQCAPTFLCHFYNIYFAHIAGGRLIVKQVSEKLLEGRDLEFNKWEGDVAMLLKDVRDNLNKVGEYWTRDEKNKCLREVTKSFRFSGQIIRLIIS